MKVMWPLYQGTSCLTPPYMVTTKCIIVAFMTDTARIRMIIEVSCGLLLTYNQSPENPNSTSSRPATMLAV